MSKVMSYQIQLPMFIRDQLTVEDEDIILGMINFAWERGYTAGYDDGYEDADSD